MSLKPAEITGENLGEGTTDPRNPQLRGRLLGTKDAAEYLGVSIWTLRDLIWNGELPIVRFGRKQYVDVKDLNALVDRNKTVYDHL